MGAIADKHRQVRREGGPLRTDPQADRIAQLEAEVQALKSRTDTVERDVSAARATTR